ncbi:MAG: transcriptional regulator [Alcanivorax sp.]|nr:transcriptional regulator [Alcanivorax sp.]
MLQPHDPLFKALADPTRRAIFEQLCHQGDQTVSALTAQAGVSQPAVSKHLGILKQAGLVSDRHEGRQTHYRAQPAALNPLKEWTQQMNAFWLARFDDLERVLQGMDQ